MNTRFKDKVIMLTGAAACNPQKQMGFAGETVWRFFKEGGSAAIIEPADIRCHKDVHLPLRA